MKKFFVGFLIGLIVGSGGVWYLSDAGRRDDLRGTLSRGGAKVQEGVSDAARELSGHAGDIKEEMARTGVVIRRKTGQAGAAIADAASDARITTAVKARLALDRELPAANISVNTTGDVVTLSGAVSSPEEVGRAIKLALEVDGVREVISALQMRAAR